MPKREVTVNVKVEKRCSTDTYFCLEAWSKGHHNDNGEAFLEFCDWSDLIITNSLYRRHDTRNPTIDTDSLVQYKVLQKEFAESVSLKLPATYVSQGMQLDWIWGSSSGDCKKEDWTTNTQRTYVGDGLQWPWRILKWNCWWRISGN